MSEQIETSEQMEMPEQIELPDEIVLPMTVPTPQPLYLKLLQRAVDAGIPIGDYVVEILRKESARKSIARGITEDIDHVVAELYKGIVLLDYPASLPMVWTYCFGTQWKSLDRGFRVKLGLRFKDLVEAVKNGTQDPPGTGVLLERCGESNQDQALYKRVKDEE